MVYITGDTHGDLTRFDAPELKRLRREDTLIVCGDFGFVWDDSPAEKKKRRALSRKKYTIAFLDGAHENFALLAAFPEETWNGGPVRRIADNLLYLTRGSVYDIEGERYFVMGGGERETFDTVAEETDAVPNESELKAGLARLAEAGNRVDYILTHEPSGKAGAYVIPKRRRSSGLDVYFDGIENTVAYRCWYFGSVHTDRRITGRHIAVYAQVLPVRTVTVGPRHRKEKKKEKNTAKR